MPPVRFNYPTFPIWTEQEPIQTRNSYDRFLPLPWFLVAVWLVIRRDSSSFKLAAFASTLILAVLTAAVYVFASVALPTMPVARSYLPQATYKTLSNPESVTVYSLDPGSEDASRAKLAGWRILGQVDVPTRPQRRVAIDAMHEAVKGFAGQQTNCFSPRHALRVTGAGHTYDFIICFGCGKIEVFEGRSASAGHPSRRRRII